MALIRPRSDPGNASGFLSARMATYCAVQSPTPLIAVRASQNRSGSCATSNCRSPVHHSCRDSPDRLGAASYQPDVLQPCSHQPLRGRKYVVQSVLDIRARQIQTLTVFSWAIRPAIVVAALTEICCPRIARIVISNPSQAPGTLTPAFFRNMAFNRPVFAERGPNLGYRCIEIENLPCYLHGFKQRVRVYAMQCQRQDIRRVDPVGSRPRRDHRAK